MTHLIPASTRSIVFNDNSLVTYIQRCKRNPVAVVLAVVVVLAAAAQFTGAWSEIRQLAGRLSGRPQVAMPGGGVCGGPGGTVAVRAYPLALTNPAELGTFVRDNALLFAQDGDAVACYRLLASTLGSNTNLSQLDALRNRAEAERQTGLEFDRTAYVTDLAGTLRELADSLPALAKADDARYRATRTYESAQAYSTLVQRAPAASAGIETLIEADQNVLRELTVRLSGE